jgi:hypothetical protein
MPRTKKIVADDYTPEEIRGAAASITAMVPGDYKTAQSILMLALTFCQSAETQRPLLRRATVPVDNGRRGTRRRRRLKSGGKVVRKPR